VAKDERREAAQAKVSTYRAQLERLIASLPLAPTLRDATFEQDTKQATDFIIATPDIRIACRIRFMDGWNVPDPYKDVTMRARPDEMAKLHHVTVHRYLYCWAWATRGRLAHYLYFDVQCAAGAGLFLRGAWPVIENPDGTAFVAIPTYKLRACAAVLAEGDIAEEEEASEPSGPVPDHYRICGGCHRPTHPAALVRRADGEEWCPRCFYDVLPNWVKSK
jgi:hypothetical protein